MTLQALGTEMVATSVLTILHLLSAVCHHQRRATIPDGQWNLSTVSAFNILEGLNFMLINIDKLMDEIIKDYDEIISDDLEERFIATYNDNKNLSEAIEQVNNQVSDDIPFPANTIKRLMVMSASMAIVNYHYQLREKLLESNIDIGDMETRNDL